MTRELFVSSTPHETKVGMVEDDQLAEVYLERENEYTLAGSIYKGRVTRVLPGMQSAFVDIGLERDAFLYVSDFMELENTDEELDDVPATPLPQERRPVEQASGEPSAAVESGEESSAAEAPAEIAETRTNGESSEDRGGRGGWRGRRRRRGNRDGRDSRDSRDRGGNGHERFNRSAELQGGAEREEYGPPAGYEPIILPGESISKYRGRGPAQEARSTATSVVETGAATADSSIPIAETFPQDEPLFAQPGRETEDVASVPAASEQAEFNQERAPVAEIRSHEPQVGSEEWDREQKRLHDMNVAAIFGGEEAVEEDETEQHEQHEQHAAEHSEEHREHSQEQPIAAAHGTMEEEEIDEEEADLIAYVEELAEDDAFDDLEEETHSAGDFVEAPEEHGIAASAENGEVPFSSEPVAEEIAEVGEAEEGVDAVAAEEAELEEAQAEAEALLDAEGRENGTVDARAELRAPAATAAYTQRTQRTGFDRDRDRGRGGRRFRGGRTKFRRREPQNLPQITDLLKEGQEILVQIAKEPIGKKGARITSHIALP